MDWPSMGFFLRGITMARKSHFTFRINEKEQLMIARLSERLQRSQSDAIRLVIREAAKSLDTMNAATGARNDQS